MIVVVFFFKQKTAYEMRISDWSSDVCSSDLRDLPIGILGALTICTLLYLSVAAVLTGVVPFRELGVPDPLSVAVEAMNEPRFALVIKLGAVIGLTSVLLVLSYGQSRVFFSMARDGLVPPLFARLQDRKSTSLNSSHSCASRLP